MVKLDPSLGRGVPPADIPEPQKFRNRQSTLQAASRKKAQNEAGTRTGLWHKTDTSVSLFVPVENPAESLPVGKTFEATETVSNGNGFDTGKTRLSDRRVSDDEKTRFSDQRVSDLVPGGNEVEEAANENAVAEAPADGIRKQKDVEVVAPSECHNSTSVATPGCSISAVAVWIFSQGDAIEKPLVPTLRARFGISARDAIRAIVQADRLRRAALYG